MKKLQYYLMMVVVVLTIGLVGCTDNQRAKNWGGTMNVQVPEGETFVNATWKDSDLWIITYKESNKTYYMHEVSTWGVLEGTVVINQ